MERNNILRQLLDPYAWNRLLNKISTYDSNTCKYLRRKNHPSSLAKHTRISGLSPSLKWLVQILCLTSNAFLYNWSVIVCCLRFIKNFLFLNKFFNDQLLLKPLPLLLISLQPFLIHLEKHKLLAKLWKIRVKKKTTQNSRTNVNLKLSSQQLHVSQWHRVFEFKIFLLLFLYCCCCCCCRCLLWQIQK